MPPFAASFFWNFRQMKKLWRKRVGVEFAMFLQIASVYAALRPTHLRQPVLCSTFEKRLTASHQARLLSPPGALLATVFTQERGV
jgi:hypothetical protein